MSGRGIEDFLKALFASEGGGNSKIINSAGYIGKYQFGEDALTDLGYFKTDGLPHIKNGKFFQDWVGVWTGKGGATSREAFLASETIQDQVARDWVKLLCKNGKRYGADQYYGQVISGFVVTESGVIAAAHLKGYGTVTSKDGTWKHPAVMAFLKTGGSIDSTDGFGTHISSYMRKFAGYELGCCRPVEMTAPWAYPFALANSNRPEALDGDTYLGTVTGKQGALSFIDDGFFPLGANGLWHGGIHFDTGTGTVLNQTDGVKCIKDGEIIAYRIERQYPEIFYPTVNRRSLYSGGFTLVRHHLTMPSDAISLLQRPESQNTSSPANQSSPSTENTPTTKQGQPVVASGSSAPATTAKTSQQPKAATPPEPPPELVFYSLYIHQLDFFGYEQNLTRARPGFWESTEEFAVGTLADDIQESVDKPADSGTPEIEAETGCDCAQASRPSKSLDGNRSNNGGEWDNVTEEEHSN